MAELSASNVLKYKGYTTKIMYSAEDRVLYGKIEGIDDLVTFNASTIESIINEFHFAVEDYIELCKESGKEPQKAYSGTFNIRIKPELHKRLAVKAKENNRSINAEVETAIRQYVEDGEQE